MIAQVTITNYTDFIRFDWGNGKPLDLYKNEIKAIVKNGRHNSIQISSGAGGSFYSGGIEIYFDRVISPIVPNLDALETLLNGYASTNRIEVGTRTFGVGTNVVVFDNPMPSANYTVLITGLTMDYPTLLTTTGFTVTNVIGGGNVYFHAIMN